MDYLIRTFDSISPVYRPKSPHHHNHQRHHQNQHQQQGLYAADEPLIFSPPPMAGRRQFQSPTVTVDKIALAVAREMKQLGRRVVSSCAGDEKLFLCLFFSKSRPFMPTA